MHAKHEPDKQFVENLEWQIGGEIRRRNRAAASAHPVWRLARAALLVVVSMAFGAAAMGASYQIEESWRRQLLETDLEVRLELARKRLELAGEEAAGVERRAAVGNAGGQEVRRTRMLLAELEAQQHLMELQFEEVRATGREPLGEVSSPVVRGRDFVTERLEVELALANQTLELARPDLERERIKLDIGTGDRLQFEAMRLSVSQYEQRVQSLNDRLAIRRGFLAGEMTGVEAELMVRIADTQAREAIARQRLGLMQLELAQVQERVRIGIDPPIAANQYELAVAEAEAELRLAQVELEVLRQELQRQRQR